MRILLVEDSQTDILLFRASLSSAARDAELTVVRDGEEAMMALQRAGEFAGRAIPDAIFLDLRLPRIDGTEVLRLIRKTPALAHVKVYVLSGTDSDEDVVETWRLQVEDFLRKPIEPAALAEICASLRPKETQPPAETHAWPGEREEEPASFVRLQHAV